MADLIGKSLGRYHILEQLGEGGMAVVYKAFDTRLEREVAVKVIRTEKLTLSTMGKSLRRFSREAKALAQLNHTNIIPVIDYGEQNKTPFLVLGYISGGTLKERLKGKSIPWQEAAHFLAPIARALDYAHKQGIVHRDIKPANILITEDEQPMLTDFGIARILKSEETLDLTGTGMGVGTPDYMAPEQGLGHKVDHRADIYALGIVFYEMVTGRKPFQADTPMAVVIKQIHDPLPRPTQFAPNIPGEVEQILLKALAKKPENRYANMGRFANALENIGEQEGRDIRSLTPDRRKRRVFVTSVMATLFLALSGIWIGTNKSLPSVSEQPSPLASISPMPSPSSIPSTSTPTETPGPVSSTRSTDGMVIFYIPAGEFNMGAPESDLHADDDEKPVHSVYLDAFWIDENEITNAMYADFLNAEGNQIEEGVNWLDADGSAVKITRIQNSWKVTSDYDKHPVVEVSWYGAQAYCKWVGGRLPTEAEWEKAARGGLERKIYPWGDETPSCQTGAKNGAQKASCAGDSISVGSFSANGYGLYDMAGNAWEWVADWYDENFYQNSPAKNPQGPDFGELKVSRGGTSWFNFSIAETRTANRNKSRPTSALINIGFRCVSDVTP